MVSAPKPWRNGPAKTCNNEPAVEMSRFPDAGDDREHLPITSLAASTWLRVSAGKFESPLHWSVGHTGRFTPASGAVGTLYLAETLTGSLAESVCRDAVWLRACEKFTPVHDLQQLDLHEIGLPEAIQVLDLTVPHLARYRLDAQIWSQRDFRNGYQWGPAWAAHAISLGLNGILYFSRSHTQSRCLALFGSPSESHGSASYDSAPYDKDRHIIEPAVTQPGITWRKRYSLMSDEVLECLEKEFEWGLI